MGRLAAAEEDLRHLNVDLERRVEERAEALETAQARLVRAERLAAIGQLTATVSHELRNPLGTIHASFLVVRSAMRDPSQRLERAIRRIDRNIDRCIDVISQLLSYSRVREGQVAPVALDELVRTVLGEQDIPQDLEVNLALHSDSVVQADGERLRQAVVNLVANACQALSESSAAVSDSQLDVSTRRVDGYAEIEVSDNGPGVPDAIRGRIFEPLVSGRSFGVGLGLPLVKDVAEAHGGSIEIADGARGGTTATLRLPAEEATG